MQNLQAIAILALCGVFLARFMRSLSPIRRRVEAGVKPWSCDLCMGFWGSLSAWAVAILVHAQSDEAMLFGLPASTALAATLLTLAKKPSIPPLPEG